MKIKIPNPKFQIPKKLQAPNPNFSVSRLVLETWDFFGAWDLGFGISEWFAI
jgi:hypothetical protein